jgi:hypothetical protein
MESNGVRLPDNMLFPEDPSRPDLDALRIAKAKQDLSHRKLDRWIVAAIADLSERGAPDQPVAQGVARTRVDKTRVDKARVDMVRVEKASVDKARLDKASVNVARGGDTGKPARQASPAASHQPLAIQSLRYFLD